MNIESIRLLIILILVATLTAVGVSFPIQYYILPQFSYLEIVGVVWLFSITIALRFFHKVWLVK